MWSVADALCPKSRGGVGSVVGIGDFGRMWSLVAWRSREAAQGGPWPSFGRKWLWGGVAMRGIAGRHCGDPSDAVTGWRAVSESRGGVQDPLRHSACMCHRPGRWMRTWCSESCVAGPRQPQGSSGPGPRRVRRTAPPLAAEADRIKSTRTGWAAPTAAVTSFWRSGRCPYPGGCGGGALGGADRSGDHGRGHPRGVDLRCRNRPPTRRCESAPTSG